jgi:GDP-L-fucose synthase
MNESDRIFVAGHRGLVGAAIVRALHQQGFKNLILRQRADLDLTRQADVEKFFSAERPDLVILAAAKVGGIVANDSQSADFIRENLLIQTHVIDAAYRSGTRKLLFLGSSCIYPKFASQPLSEDSLLTGSLEPTNEAYAIAKIAGIKMCAAYRRQFGFNAICAMPTNIYGPGDNFDLHTSHVLPALIRKFHEAKVSGAEKVVVWGSGTPKREFLHVDDLARACIFLMNEYELADPINVGCGEDLSIAELAGVVSEVVGFGGGIEFDRSRPDGTPRKLLDVRRLHSLGWRPAVSLRNGLVSTYEWFLQNRQTLRA